MSVKCFWLEPLRRTRLSLRCHATGPCAAMPGEYGYHNATVPMIDVVLDEQNNPLGPTRPEQVADEWQDKWPAACGCGFTFAPEHRHVFSEHLYRRADTGDVVTLRSAPPGAMWDATWMHDYKGGALFGPGDDGIVLIVKLPNGNDWCVDQRASNCTMPSDDNHRCWIRHGDPRTADVTVDKNGRTCAAGAGSIQSGDYHGFLQGGALT